MCATPGVPAIVLATDVTCGLAGPAFTSARTPAVGSAPVIRSSVAWACADGELGSWKLFWAFSFDVAGAPKTPAAIKQIRAMIAIVLGLRTAMRASELNMDASSP